MRSFAAVFLAATLATFSVAAPLSPPPGTNAVTPLTSVVNTGVVPVGQVKSLTGNVHTRDTVKTIQSVVSGLHARDGPVSVAVIIGDLQTDIGPAIQQLAIVDVNTDISVIVTNVNTVKASLLAAIPKLVALVGLDVKIILDDGHGVQLTVSGLANIVATNILFPVLKVVAHILAVVKGDIAVKVQFILKDLVITVLKVAAAVVRDVADIRVTLRGLLASVDAVVARLGVDISVYL